MPTFNNPAYATAYSNLAEMFKPPSAQDIYAYQRAAAERAKESRLAEFYKQSIDPNVDSATRDRYGVGSGAYLPNQSYYSVDQDNAVKRYGIDVGARTSLTNNEADNARALQANQADNARALEAARLEQAGAGQRNILDNQTRAILGLRGPLHQGQVVPALEPDLASILGLPAMPSVAGAPKPLTETEAKAAAFQRLAPGQQEAIASDTPTEKVSDGNGGAIFMSRGAAARDQAPVYEAPSNDVMNWVSPDGKAGGTARLRPDGKLIDTQTNAEIPAGSKTAKGQMTGAPGEFGKSTEQQQTGAYIARVVKPAITRLVDAYDKGKTPSTGDSVLFNLKQMSPNVVAPVFSAGISDQGKEFYYDLMQALPYELMKRSGQAVNTDEYQRALLQVTPDPTDTPAIRAARREHFATFYDAVRKSAGPALPGDELPDLPPSPGAPRAAAPAGGSAAPVRRTIPGSGTFEQDPQTKQWFKVD